MSHVSSLILCVLMLLLMGHAGVRASGTWASQRSGTMAMLHAVYFLDQRKGWAAGSSGNLLTTSDGGATWTAMHRPTEDTLRDVYFSDEQHGWLVCERNIYLLKTKDEPRTYLMNTVDGGRNWKRVNVIGSDVDARLVRALFKDGGRAWAFGEGGALYTTRDGGTSWERQSVPTRHLLLGGAFLDGEQGWLVGPGPTVIRTSDGGQTWRGDADILDGVGARFNAVSFADKRRGWIVGAEGVVFMTKNGGRSWSWQPTHLEADLFDVKFFDANEGWAIGSEGTVIHTTDGGAHWTTVPSDTTHPLERLYFVDREHGWAVGFGGTIIAYAPSGPPPTPELKSQKVKN